MSEMNDVNSRCGHDRWKLLSNLEEIKALEVKVAKLLARRDELQSDSDRRGEVVECSRCHKVEAIARASGDVSTFIRITNASARGSEMVCAGCLESVASVHG